VLSGLPSEVRGDALKALAETAWPRETVRDVAAGWFQTFKRDPDQDQFVEDVVQASLARGDSWLAKQMLLSAYPSWRRSFVSHQPRQLPAMLRAVVDHDVGRGTVDAATEDVLALAEPLMGRSALASLAETVAKYHLGRDPEQAAAFLQKIRPSLSSEGGTPFFDLEVRRVYESLPK
jgi:hypothetical protein